MDDSLSHFSYPMCLLCLFAVLTFGLAGCTSGEDADEITSSRARVDDDMLSILGVKKNSEKEALSSESPLNMRVNEPQFDATKQQPETALPARQGSSLDF